MPLIVTMRCDERYLCIPSIYVSNTDLIPLQNPPKRKPLKSFCEYFALKVITLGEKGSPAQTFDLEARKRRDCDHSAGIDLHRLISYILRSAKIRLEDGSRCETSRTDCGKRKSASGQNTDGQLDPQPSILLSRDTR